MRSKKKRKPKLTRIEKMTKGLMLSAEEIKSKFSVREVDEKGRALFLLSRIIRKDSFVLEYEGDVITHDEAEFREKIYEMNDEGCYILFFRFQERRLAIDATRRFDSYARYLNHSREPNIRFHPPLLLDLTGRGVPRIAAYALRDIHEGEEIVFDYGVSDGKISWLRNRKRCHASELTDSSSNEDSDSSSDNDDDDQSSQDQIVSVTRTPKRNILLKPSKYLSPVKLPTSNPGPPSLAVPRDGYGIRYISYPARPGMKKCYVASMEGLGQPLKIMRSVEERTSTRREGNQKPSSILNGESKSSRSIISLSESDDSSMKSPINILPSEHSTDPCLPRNISPCSSSKVLEWQQNSPSVKQQDVVSNIQILHVRTLTEENESLVPPSPYSSINNTTLHNVPPKNSVSSLPCISDVFNGSSVPKSFVPNMHPHSHYDSAREEMSAHHIPCNSTEAAACNSPKHSQRDFHLNVQRSPSKIRFDNVSSGAISKNTSSVNFCPVKQTSNISPIRPHKQSDANEMICLSDSEEDDVVQISGYHFNQLPQSNALNSPVSLKSGISCDNSLSKTVNSNVPTVAGSRKLQRKGKVEDIVISNVESLSTGLDNAQTEVHTVIPDQDSRVKGESQSHNVQIHNVNSCKSTGSGNAQYEHPNHSGSSSSSQVHHGYQNQGSNGQGDGVWGEFQNLKNNIFQNEHENPHRNRTALERKPKKPVAKREDVDVVEIFDEEESDFEILSDGEWPSTSLPISNSNNVQNNHQPQNRAGVSTAPAKPSCSKISSVPSDSSNHHHRSKPHVAIVKPYSKENDQKTASEQRPTGNNCKTETTEEGKSAVEDVIEVMEGNSSEDDDGIVLAEDKPLVKCENRELTFQEIETMKEIFQPLILSSNSLSSSCVENAISENFTFFSVLIGRGVPVNEIRRTVWKLFKASGKETPMQT